ncbi:FUSC family protein [Catenulispora sp. NL8]|uniref:FUSC family protein n=1 Tax=Catenulispora pinistramenti TaxID=2705254 RepID=A0ABS5KN69_9ACTN|nr:FUSC family protein [Catenulispora pinistramenti]MBS2547469.1 FUSC family protein [Catenulispora pinistramenti]
MITTNPLRFRRGALRMGTLRLGALRAATVATASALAALASAIWLEHHAHLGMDVVVTAVALSVTLARVQRGTGHLDRLIGVVVIAASAAVASEVGSLLVRHPILGDAAFVTAMSGAIWIRRFGARATIAGTFLVLPFVALLVTHTEGARPYAADHDAWSALIAVVAASWVWLGQLLAAAVRFDRPRPRPAARPAPAGGTKRRIPASTRMALQMAAALAAAFAAGHLVFHAHWPWAVLTAFIVCSGARGRGDVLHKSVERACGAAVGTVVATWIAGSFPAHDRWSIVLIFTVLAIAGWLREISYALWAGSVTAVLSLLYGYYGQSAPSLLLTRLEAILVGATLGAAASWLILPVRTGDVFKRRVADALAALADFLGTPIGDRAEARQRGARFLQTAELLEQIAKPIRTHRMLLRHARSARSASRPRRTTGLVSHPAAHPADAIDAVRACIAPVELLAKAFADTPPEPTPAWAGLQGAVAANVGTVRLRLGGRTGPAYRRLPHLASTTAGSALLDVDAALAVLDRTV